MQLVGECQEPAQGADIVKVLITIDSGKHPEYVLINVLKERGGFEAGRRYRITIAEEE